MACRSVSLSVTTMSTAKATEPTLMPSQKLIRVGPRNHVFDGIQKPTRKLGNFEGKKWLAQDMPGQVRELIYTKRLSRGQKRYGLDANWGVLDGVRLAPPGEYD